MSIERVVTARPALAILQINSNDPASGYPLQETVANHRLLLDSLKAHGIPAIVIGPFPRKLAKPGLMVKVRDSLLLSVSAVARLPLWDSLALDSLHVKEVYASKDGVHLNDSGHALIHRQVLRHPLWKAFCPER